MANGTTGPGHWPGGHQRGLRVFARRSHPPDAEIYAIDVSFAALPDKAERDYLNQQPTTFVLPAEAVDRLRKAAGTIIQARPNSSGC